jgi:dipeptidyl-peptidase-4
MRPLLLLILALASCSAPPAPAAPAREGGILTVDRIFGSREFSSEGYSVHWEPRGASYVTVDRSSLVRHDVSTGQSEVLIPAAELVPEGAPAPLPIESYEASADFSRLLIYTNSRRVWRQNTRGDYWVLDRRAHSLRKLGGDAPPSSLMFAKLSPSGRHAAYVREGSLYLEDREDRSIRCLARAEDPKIVNGTADWVYE